MNDAKATRARQQIEESVDQLNALRNANTRDAGFKEWRQSTLTLLQRLWPGDDTQSGHFRRIPFSPPSSRSDSKQTRESYERGIAEAATLLRSLIEELGGPRAVPERGARTRPVHDPELTADEAESPESADSERSGSGIASVSSRVPASRPESSEPAPTPRPITPVSIPRLPRSGMNPPASTPSQEMESPRHIEHTRRALPPGVRPLATPAAVEPVSAHAESAPPAAAESDSMPALGPAPPNFPPPSVATAAAPPITSTPAPAPAAPPMAATPAALSAPPAADVPPATPARHGKPARKSGQKPRLKDMLGFTDDIEFRSTHAGPASPARRELDSVDADPLDAPMGFAAAEPPPAKASKVDEAALQEALEAALQPIDDRIRALEAEDLLGTSPVFRAKGKPLKKKSAATQAPSHTPAALAVLAMASEIQALGVPEGHRARARAALIDLASHLDHHDLTWNGLREAIGFAMEFPGIGRRVLPLLLPYLEEAA